jgi:hypothetical protein
MNIVVEPAAGNMIGNEFIDPEGISYLCIIITSIIYSQKTFH